MVQRSGDERAAGRGGPEEETLEEASQAEVEAAIRDAESDEPTEILVGS